MKTIGYYFRTPLLFFFGLKHWANILLLAGFTVAALGALGIGYLALNPIGESHVVIGTVNESGIRRTYRCEDGAIFTVLYVKNLAKVNLPDGRHAVLPHANEITLDEYNRYANASHTIALSHDSHGAFFEEKGEKTYRGCSVVATENLLS